MKNLETWMIMVFWDELESVLNDFLIDGVWGLCLMELMVGMMRKWRNGSEKWWFSSLRGHGFIESNVDHIKSQLFCMQQNVSLQNSY